MKKEIVLALFLSYILFVGHNCYAKEKEQIISTQGENFSTQDQKILKKTNKNEPKTNQNRYKIIWKKTKKLETLNKTKYKKNKELECYQKILKMEQDKLDSLESKNKEGE